MKNYDNFFMPADDYEKSKKFYSEILGMRLKFELKEQGMAAFCVGDKEPAIILKDKNKFLGTAPAIWIEVTDVRVLYKELKNKGARFSSQPFKIRTGWTVEFIDPLGNTPGLADYNK